MNFPNNKSVKKVDYHFGRKVFNKLMSFIVDVGLKNHSCLQLCCSILLLSHLFTFNHQEALPRWIISTTKVWKKWNVVLFGRKGEQGVQQIQDIFKLWAVLPFASCSFTEIENDEEWVLTACIPFVTIYWKMNVTGGHNITFHDKAKTWQHYNAVKRCFQDE